MQKAGAKLMFLFLCTVCLIANAALVPADAGIGSRASAQVSGPSQPPQPRPRPGNPTGPGSPPAPDGGSPLPTCAPGGCPSSY
jgi:hypothetical protein